MQPMIMAHGGAWDWDDALDAPKEAGLAAAVRIGYDILLAGGSALDAVEQTVRALEDNPLYDAGTGGHLNQDGLVQLDALIVDGSRYEFGAVAGVTRLKNPITLARKVMEETEQCFFVGEGADRIALQFGIAHIDNAVLVTPAMRAAYEAQHKSGHDTVGAVAMDMHGNMAVATSTSGTPYKPSGRVGDSPLYGAGGYALNGAGTVGATGKGENIMRVLLAKVTCDLMSAGHDASVAAGLAMQHVERIFPNSMCGVIVIDAQGKPGAAHTTPKLAHGYVDADGHIRTGMRRK
jgi:L-asparaginase / beta-aspartyl-peptidase